MFVFHQAFVVDYICITETLHIFFFPFRRLTYLLLVQFCPTKTILTFVGTQVNPGFWVEHSNHYNFIITRLRVTFKQKVQKFKFSTIMLFTDLKPRASTGKLISLPLASRKSWFDILRATHIDKQRPQSSLLMTVRLWCENLSQSSTHCKCIPARQAWNCSNSVFYYVVNWPSTIKRQHKRTAWIIPQLFLGFFRDLMLPTFGPCEFCS